CPKGKHATGRICFLFSAVPANRTNYKGPCSFLHCESVWTVYLGAGLLWMGLLDSSRVGMVAYQRE
ncbi:MAG: hypothetical protein LBL58_16020, partial [Tannerellaceae bacterium]|nr:hypothetical protein [Tannerellaceae bacterium]